MPYALDKDLFVLPEREKFILYLPLNGTILQVNSGTVQLLQKIKSTGKAEADPKLLEVLEKTGGILGSGLIYLC